MIRSSVREMMELCTKLSVYEVFGPLKHYDLFGHGKKLTAAMLRYDRLIEEIMKDNENRELKVGSGDESSHNLMELLLAASRDVADDIILTRRHIKNFILRHMSTAALQWAMAALINIPAILEKLREEIRSVVPKGMIKEWTSQTSHSYSPWQRRPCGCTHRRRRSLFRECSRDCQVGEYRVKAGIRVFINMYAIMRDPGMWTDQEEFVQERFLTKDAAIMDFQYFPSGGGRRACIGTAFVNTVMALTIRTLAQCFDWENENGAKIDVNVGSVFSGTMAQPLLCNPITL